MTRMIYFSFLESRSWRRKHRLPALPVIAAACLVILAAVASARAQDAEQAGGVTTWKDVEQSAAFKEIATAIKGGGYAFDDAAKTFLQTSLFPLLEHEANRPTLDDVRKKIRDRFLLAIGNDQAFEQANAFVSASMTDVARNVKADPVVRAQAMLLVGDLIDKGRLPWTPAAETLAAAVRDSSLPAGVRVAAMAGLGLHANAVPRLAADRAETVRTTVAAAVESLLEAAAEKPARSRGVEEAWMASRGLGILPIVTNPAGAEMASRLTATSDDESWPIDVRVRAAAALGKTVGPESGVKGPEAVAALRKLAIAALEADRVAANRVLDLREYTGGAGQPAFQPRGPMPVPGSQGPGADGFSELACRRTAWRLYTLGDAIDAKGRKATLASLCEGKEAEDARKLATLLKQSGERLNTEPFGYVFFEIFDAVDPAGAKKRANELARRPVEEPDAAEEGEQPGDAKDQKPGTKPNENPFGDNPFGQ